MATALESPILDPSRLRHEIAQFPGVGPNAGAGLLEQLREQLQHGRGEIAAYFEAGGSAEVVHRELSRQMDAVVQGTLDFGQARLYGSANPTTGGELAVVAVGGYGRQELAQLRTEIRPQRAKAVRPMRPRREVDAVEPGLHEGS